MSRPGPPEGATFQLVAQSVRGGKGGPRRQDYVLTTIEDRAGKMVLNSKEAAHVSVAFVRHESTTASKLRQARITNAHDDVAFASAVLEAQTKKRRREEEDDLRVAQAHGRNKAAFRSSSLSALSKLMDEASPAAAASPPAQPTPKSPKRPTPTRKTKSELLSQLPYDDDAESP